MFPGAIHEPRACVVAMFCPSSLAYLAVRRVPTCPNRKTVMSPPDSRRFPEVHIEIDPETGRPGHLSQARVSQAQNSGSKCCPPRRLRPFIRARPSVFVRPGFLCQRAMVGISGPPGDKQLLVPCRAQDLCAGVLEAEYERTLAEGAMQG